MLSMPRNVLKAKIIIFVRGIFMFKNVCIQNKTKTQHSTSMSKRKRERKCEEIMFSTQIPKRLKFMDFSPAVSQLFSPIYMFFFPSTVNIKPSIRKRKCSGIHRILRNMRKCKYFYMIPKKKKKTKKWKLKNKNKT